MMFSFFITIIKVSLHAPVFVMSSPEKYLKYLEKNMNKEEFLKKSTIK